MKKINFNNFWIGLIPGLILPIIFVWLFYKRQYGYLSVEEFIDLIQQANIYTQLISICVLPNLILFFAFIKNNKLYGARGTMAATLLYVFLVFGLKFYA